MSVGGRQSTFNAFSPKEEGRRKRRMNKRGLTPPPPSTTPLSPPLPSTPQRLISKRTEDRVIEQIDGEREKRRGEENENKSNCE